MNRQSQTGVYVIQDAAENFKVGLSANPWTRRGELQTGNATPLTISLVVMYQTRHEAQTVERKAHEYLDDAEARMLGEWFGCPYESVLKAISKAEIGAGFRNVKIYE